MKKSVFFPLRNGVAVPRSRLPVSSLEVLREATIDAVTRGKRIAALFVSRPDAMSALHLYAVLADDEAGRLAVGLAPVVGDAYPAFTAGCTQAHLFEREIAEQFGLRPEGHPWLKPLRFHPPYDAAGRTGGAWPLVGDMDFYRVEGDEVHEVAVGPVHAGVIEPGHFRFQCHGEQVFHLEISLGYQHRGIERALVGGPHRRTGVQMETAAGDTTIGHGTAYAQALEGLGGAAAPARAQSIRAIALELERLANHVGDLGALAGDVAFLPTASFCGRLRGDYLNLSAEICGNRFGRGLIRPGGVGFDLDAERIRRMRERLRRAGSETKEAIELLWSTPTVVARFEGTGALGREVGLELGMVGVAARAMAIERDVRHDFPYGIYRYAHLPVAAAASGDVQARALVRWLEIQRSLDFVDQQLAALPSGETRVNVDTPRPEMLVASLVEGWRGEIVHVALTDAAGRFERYKIVDPSFHNWTGLAIALRGGEISDFPLCNKSFNLSYCGHDL